MPGPLDGQTKVEVGQDAVIGRRRRREKLKHLVGEDGRLDPRLPHVDQCPVERRVAKPQPDGAVASDADVRVGVGRGHRGAARVEVAPIAHIGHCCVVGSCCYGTETKPRDQNDITLFSGTC